MIESPLLQELLGECRQKDIVRVLKARFGPVPQDLSQKLQAIYDERVLDILFEFAAICPDLESVERHLRE